MLAEWTLAWLHQAVATAQAMLSAEPSPCENPVEDKSSSRQRAGSQPTLLWNGSPTRPRRLSRTAPGPSPPIRIPQPNQAYCILALDGHGTSMLYHAILLERLWLENPDMLARIDLFAGTSGGAITALLLAYGYTPSEVVAIYRKELPQLVSSFPPWLDWRLLWPFQARFSEQHKMAMLSKYLGHTRLRDLVRPVLVTAFDMEGQPERTARANPVVLAANAPGRALEEPLYHWEPALFSNLPAHSRLTQLQDSSLSLVEVAMRATASPSYFPIYQGHIDGTVFANNPALTAVARAAASYPDAVGTTNTVVLSLGGPLVRHAQALTRADWGIVQWVPWLVALLFNATHAALDTAVGVFLKQRYLRLAPEQPSTLRLDHISSLEPLASTADSQPLTEAFAFIRTYITPATPTAEHPAHPMATT